MRPLFSANSPAQLTKAQVLLELRPLLTLFSVPDVFILKTDDIPKLDIDDFCQKLIRKFGSEPLIVRSSARDEDSEGSSNAGAYESVLGVCADDAEAVGVAIETVHRSFGRGSREAGHDEIFFQTLVEKPLVSGVVFTRELSSGAPYYVINYDDQTGLTNTVTSGGGEYSNRTLYVHHSSANEIRSARFSRLIAAVKELEAVLDSSLLDIEFAIDHDLQPYLFQVRTITTADNWQRDLTGKVDSALLGVKLFLSEKFARQPGVFGSTTVFGQMPDWNPAEMIGRAPRALSLSLYKRLITDDAWRLARECMGYAVPEGRSLMVSLGGQPFIDARLSFHSFLPATLPPSIADKLVSGWVERLREQPELHDKIEFDVAITTFSFDLDERFDTHAGFLDSDERDIFREALQSLTAPLLQGSGQGSIEAALALTEQLASCELPASSSGVPGLLCLIEKCVRYGTLPFSILARHGFIARTLLLSLVRRGVLDEDSVASLQGSVRTVAGELLDQIHALQRNDLSRVEFMRRYGHLRPGTYDILSPRYDQMQTFGEISMPNQVVYDNAEPFVLDDNQRRAVDALLKEAPFLGLDCEGLLSYCSAATAGREYGKFVFTRSVSAMLELIAEYGERHGLTREEMSHVPVGAILDIGQVSGGGESVKERLQEVASKNAERHALTAAIRLPQVLFDEAGVHIVPFQVSQPNFITRGKISAEAYYLGLHKPSSDLTGCIVLIENADPGYDWIFAHAIAGLITKYGGANSHMAIRCAEFGIPAAIGCGEQRFDTLCKAARLSLDCSVGLITPIH